jgi:hypothetical protein
MKVLTASAPGHLKLALLTTNPNEFSEAPDCAYLEISAAEATALLDLIGVTQQFGRRTAASGLIERCYDISLGLGRRLPVFRVLHLPFADDEAPDHERPIVLLPEDFDPETLGEHAEHRVECHRIEVGENTVRFSALLRHGDDRFVTTSLDGELLGRIARDCPTALPAVRLGRHHAFV